MKHQRGLVIVVAVFAVGQAIFGILRALDWVRIGADLIGQGLLLTNLVGMLAIARGWIIDIVASIYAFFAVGAVLDKQWVWWLRLIAVIMNILLILNSSTGGQSFGRAAPWLIVPLILLVYLFSAGGKRGFAHQGAQ